MISPHSSRLYFAANKLFRSDDHGDSWTAVSPDLTRQIDRNKLKVMGRVWSVDAVAKNASTSFYGTIVSLTESPLVEGLIYVGTDDGLVRVTEDGGRHWRKIAKFPTVPETTYVSSLYASRFDPNTVYAAFDNHKNADFRPYLLKSTDRGRTWKSIASNLPQTGPVYSIIQDHVKPGLLFVGTEYGVFFTINGGKKWIQLKGGLPTIAVRDMDIQRRENDLVLATFGRGFYVLDNYSPLREITETNLKEKKSLLFPVKDALMFVKKSGTFGSLGSSFFKAKNPPFGATFTYYLKEAPKTLKQRRQEREKKLIKAHKPVYYPSWEELRKEDREEKPFLLFEVYDEDGNVVRNLKVPAKAGINRVTWDLRYPSSDPVKKKTEKNPSGFPVMPGKYSVKMFLSVNGKLQELAGPQSFSAKILENSTLPAKDRGALVAFQRKVAELDRAVSGAVQSTRDLQKKTDVLISAIKQAPAPPDSLMSAALHIKRETEDILQRLVNDNTVSKRHEPTPPTVSSRLGEIAWTLWRTTSAPTKTQQSSYEIATKQFQPLLKRVQRLLTIDLKKLESAMEANGAPWTPGRVPDWKH